MGCGPTWDARRPKKERTAADEAGEYWRCTLIEPSTRLRVGRGIGQNETEAAIALWEQVKQRDAHRDAPPPLLSDGWGGHREALVEAYGQVPTYAGRGRPPSVKQPGPDWHYTQMVKQRDERGNFTGVELRIIYGDDTTLERSGTRTVYVERTHLTSRHMNARLTRKTLGFSKQLAMLGASSVWEDTVYNLGRSVRTLRVKVDEGQRVWRPVSPAMQAGLTDHIWSIHELLTRVPVPVNP
jgi:hypothetical protein